MLASSSALNRCRRLAFPHIDFAYAERVEGYVKGWRRVFHQVRLRSFCVKTVSDLDAVTPTAHSMSLLGPAGQHRPPWDPRCSCNTANAADHPQERIFHWSRPQTVCSHVAVCTAAEAPGRTVTLIEDSQSITVRHARDAATAYCHQRSCYLKDVHGQRLRMPCCSGVPHTAWMARQKSSSKHSRFKIGLTSVTHCLRTMSSRCLAILHPLGRINRNVLLGRLQCLTAVLGVEGEAV